MLLCSTMRTVCARLVLRAAVSGALGVYPAQRFSQCLSRGTDSGVPAACFVVKSRVRWLLERALSWHTGAPNGCASRGLKRDRGPSNEDPRARC
jgi:hypothetical protein